jgi:hypothetical protein
MKLTPLALTVGPFGSTIDPQGTLQTYTSPCELFSTSYTSCTELRCSNTWTLFRSQGCTKIRFTSSYRQFPIRNDLVGDLEAFIGRCSPVGVWNTFRSVRVSKAGQWILAELADCVSDPGSGHAPDLRNCTVCSS